MMDTSWIGPWATEHWLSTFLLVGAGGFGLLMLAGFVVFLVAAIAEMAIKASFRAWNRWLRSRNVKHAGWPPPHLDADGDFLPRDPTPADAEAPDVH